MDNLAFLEDVRARGGVMMKVTPHSRAIGMQLVDVAPNTALIMAPYAPELVGNPDTGVIHGGVITSLLDNASGLSVSCHMGERKSMATLDLRIDYMHPAAPGEAVYARAECYKVTNNVAFVRGIAYQLKDGAHNVDDPIATCVATFMMTDGPIPDLDSMMALAAANGFPVNKEEA
ncbi:MAG: PaaI family thioesterase [Alphaproteobacteria bacterium]|nr:PaaI family thioesterase [Alphaproteobacteria bacterium]